jgi:putative ABC transport system permease protein
VTRSAAGRHAGELLLAAPAAALSPQVTCELRSASRPAEPAIRSEGWPTLDTEAGWVEERASGLDQVLNLFYDLLALSVIVSLFGMVNTLILSVFERTRELGMLRAVGMTRRQVRRMVRQESVITALIGAAVALPLGMLLAALVSNALADEGIGFQVPGGQLVAFTIIAVIAGVLAAIVPARRAAKLNVLKALQYE